MFRSGLGMPRYVRLLAPVAAAIVAAGGGVVAVSHATDSTQSQPPLGPAERQGLALQNAFVKVVSSISPSVVQIEDHRGECSLAKQLQSGYAVPDYLDLISFGGKKTLQNFPQSTIVLDNQNSIQRGWSWFGY